ncbi:hypothetical protein LTR10_002960 [Elasticomyces elasticus]|nr:hypothetical protein LTR10_002960 [Elasticomyces elasticus]KAK4967702.1 hypothetical protein LTR42_010027 [Elasticomyces elasticus]
MAQSTETISGTDVKVIGLYGIPGSGKTTLLQRLRALMDSRYFAFYEGSDVLDSLVPQGLDAFKAMVKNEQQVWREAAIVKIRKECSENGKTGVVAGHFMFWDEDESTEPESICTEKDLEVYTHIVYLDVDAEIIVRQRLADSQRSRSAVSADYVRKWKKAEQSRLRDLCYDNGILFSTVFTRSTSIKETLRVIDLLHDFRNHTDALNALKVEVKLDEAVSKNHALLQTMLVFDADKTLASVDTGEVCFRREEMSPLKKLFDSMGYSYKSFRQATLIYEHHKDEEAFETMCQWMGNQIELSAEISNLLKAVDKHDHVGVVVVTCGLRLAWEKVLAKAGLTSSISVIGGGRISDGYVVTPDTKAEVVVRLQKHHGLHVIAFGDSPTDLPMLKQADEAIVVVGEAEFRSRTMDRELQTAIDEHGLQVRQALIPASADARLIRRLPEVELWSQDFIDDITKSRLPIFHATDSLYAKLLQTPMRNASVSGAALREAHRRAGYALATGMVTNVIGLEEYTILHVQQNKTTKGHRLRDEQTTTIVPLLRGGEPMAFGVADAFPSAMFVHAKKPDQLKAGHLESQSTVLLVDSVINTGKSIIEFEEHIRRLRPNIRIVVIAGVVQVSTVKSGGCIRKLAMDKNFSVVALRFSENSYTGHKATDTGDRLFNTTQVD